MHFFKYTGLFILIISCTPKGEENSNSKIPIKMAGSDSIGVENIKDKTPLEQTGYSAPAEKFTPREFIPQKRAVAANQLDLHTLPKLIVRINRCFSSHRQKSAGNPLVPVGIASKKTKSLGSNHGMSAAAGNTTSSRMKYSKPPHGKKKWHIKEANQAKPLYSRPPSEVSAPALAETKPAKQNIPDREIAQIAVDDSVDNTDAGYDEG
jgi:hypothetical protein